MRIQARRIAAKQPSRVTACTLMIDRAAGKMKDCRWLRPELVGQFEFVEWTPDALRHSAFIGLREDKDGDQSSARISEWSGNC